jgi:hypothetical protein
MIADSKEQAQLAGRPQLAGMPLAKRTLVARTGTVHDPAAKEDSS